MFDAFVPDGPLHPIDAAWGLAIGLGVAALAGRRTGRWVALVLAGFVGVVGLRYGNEIGHGYQARPAPLLPLAATVLVVAAACRLRPRAATVAPGVVAALIGVWAVVPDTEVPLVAGAVLVGAATRMPLGAGRASSGLLLGVPMAAAVAGSVGRPGRLGPSLLLASAGFCVALGASAGARWCLDRRRPRRQRAGTPTTVLPGGTSSVTTAPAPTTAS